MLAKFRWVVERHGLANLLFHPDYNLEERRLRDYAKVIKSIRATDGGWIATAREIADWWDRRRASTLVEERGGARVEGPAAADATVWLARRDGPRVRVVPPT
jgi:hypothetical protein